MGGEYDEPISLAEVEARLTALSVHLWKMIDEGRDYGKSQRAIQQFESVVSEVALALGNFRRDKPWRLPTLSCAWTEERGRLMEASETDGHVTGPQACNDSECRYTCCEECMSWHHYCEECSTNKGGE